MDQVRLVGLEALPQLAGSRQADFQAGVVGDRDAEHFVDDEGTISR